MPARDRTMYKDTVYEYYEGFTKGLTVHCIFKQALKHKWMIYSDIKWIMEKLNDQDLTTKIQQEKTPFV